MEEHVFINRKKTIILPPAATFMVVNAEENLQKHRVFYRQSRRSIVMPSLIWRLMTIICRGGKELCKMIQK